MEVHQSLNETMHLFDECVEELIYLLTNFYMVAMDTQSKQMEDADWLSGVFWIVWTWLESC